MIRNTTLFIQTLQKVKQLSVLPQIIEQSKKKFDLLPLKIEQLIQDKIIRLYNNLQNKYYNTKQLAFDQYNWREGQRRLFVIFIICFEYFLQKKNIKWNQQHWNQLSGQFFNKDPDFLEFQYLNLLKVKNRISWTQQQDNMLIKFINQQQESYFSWNQISKKIFFSTKKAIFKSSKHCRERWFNHLDNSKVHGQWTSEEDYEIFQYVLQNGKRWCKMVPLLNDKRTQHMIKNRYNSLLNKNRTNKKQKEQQIAQKIYHDLKMIIGERSNVMMQKQQQNNQNQKYVQIKNNQEYFNMQIQEKSPYQQVERQRQDINGNRIKIPTETMDDFSMMNKVVNNLNPNQLGAPHNFFQFYYGLNNNLLGYPAFMQPTLANPFFAFTQPNQYPPSNFIQPNFMKEQSNFYFYTPQNETH